MKSANDFARLHFLQIERTGRGNGKITPFCVRLTQPIGNVSVRGKLNQNINAGETRKMRLHLMTFRFPCFTSGGPLMSIVITSGFALCLQISRNIREVLRDPTILVCRKLTN
jgi:hypothetical protein